jgi:uncharacterized protein involved in exopolysaccharide biosynthesis
MHYAETPSTPARDQRVFFGFIGALLGRVLGVVAGLLLRVYHDRDATDVRRGEE